MRWSYRFGPNNNTKEKLPKLDPIVYFSLNDIIRVHVYTWLFITIVFKIPQIVDFLKDHQEVKKNIWYVVGIYTLNSTNYIYVMEYYITQYHGDIAPASLSGTQVLWEKNIFSFMPKWNIWGHFMTREWSCSSYLQ